jgi:thiol-disulfide isomerase/thioredoxin
MRKLSFLLLLFSAQAYSQVTDWACGIVIQGDTIRFGLHRNAKGLFSIQNGEEQVMMEQKRQFGDSCEFALSVFDASLVFSMKSEAKMLGWYRKGDARIPTAGLPFFAKRRTGNPFGPDSAAWMKVQGRWPIEFLDGEKVVDRGILVLNQNGNYLKGSILNETGDYRFLNGQIKRREAFLQTFDGGHAYFFRIRFSEDVSRLDGVFKYSQSGKQEFRGIRNDLAELSGGFASSDQNKLLEFMGKDENGAIRTRKDFQGKALVVQLRGSWCPNCLDETRFLVEEFSSRPANVEFIGLAFERKDDAYGLERIATVKRKLSVPYPVLLGGKANKDSASRAIPAAGGIKAFPTTLFVKANGEVWKIHSGFSGPATGEPYEAWRREFRKLVQEIKP